MALRVLDVVLLVLIALALAGVVGIFVARLSDRRRRPMPAAADPAPEFALDAWISNAPLPSPNAAPAA